MTFRAAAYVLGLAIVCVVLMALMLITGYVPLDQWSKSPAHAARYALVGGFACGLLMAIAIILLTLVRNDRNDRIDRKGSR